MDRPKATINIAIIRPLFVQSAVVRLQKTQACIPLHTRDIVIIHVVTRVDCIMQAFSVVLLAHTIQMHLVCITQPVDICLNNEYTMTRNNIR